MVLLDSLSSYLTKNECLCPRIIGHKGEEAENYGGLIEISKDKTVRYKFCHI